MRVASRGRRVDTSGRRLTVGNGNVKIPWPQFRCEATSAAVSCPRLAGEGGGRGEVLH